MQLHSCCILVNIEDSEGFVTIWAGLQRSSFGFEAMLRNFLGRGPYSERSAEWHCCGSTLYDKTEGFVDNPHDFISEQCLFQQSCCMIFDAKLAVISQQILYILQPNHQNYHFIQAPTTLPTFPFVYPRPSLSFLLLMIQTFKSIKKIAIIMQLYSIKAVVQIQRVKLNIRFPGQLSFQFKNNHLYEDIPKMYQLINGECLVDQSVALQVEAQFNVSTDSYSEVMVDLIVSINTSSGKIVAGVVTFNAIQNCTAVLPLKRCSDKTAEVSMNIGFARIKKIKDIEQQPVIKKERSQSRLLVSARPRDKSSYKELRPSYLGTQRKETERKQTERNESKDSRTLIASKVVKTVAVDSRYKELEENYERKMKQLNKEKQELEAQLQTTRERYKLSQRREKEMQVSTKDLKDLAQKRRVKIIDLQGKIGDYQRLMQDYEKKVKLTQQESKLTSDKIEDLSSKYLMLEKKLESKEQTSNEREKRLTDKLQQLEGEHSKTVHQYNLLLEKMEQQEKANQTIFKNKEKGYLEEKVKWKEQFQKSQKSLAKMKEEFDQLTVRFNAASANQKTFMLKLSELQSEHELLKNADENKRMLIEKEQSIRRQLERELEELRGVEVDKNSLKKRINQHSQDYLRLKEKYDKLSLENQQLRDNLKSYEKLLEQLKKDKKTMTSKCSDLEKTVSQLQKETARISTQNNNLSSKNTYLNERLNDLKTKSQQENSNHKENQSQLQSKISSLIQSKQYLQADIQDLKWSLEKAEESIFDCQKKLKEKNEEILKYQEETLKLEKEGDNLSTKLEDAKNSINSLKNQVVECKRREHELLETLKEKERKIYELMKKISELEQDGFINSSKQANSIEAYKESLANKEEIIEELKTEAAQRKAKMAELQNSLEKLEEDHQEQERQIKLLAQSLEESDRNLKLQRQQKDELKKAKESLKRQLQESHSKLSEEEKGYVEEISGLKVSKELLEKQLKASQLDNQTYKKSVQQLLMIVSKEEEVSKSEEIIALPDENLAKNQLQALLNRNKYLNTFKTTISELRVEITYLHKENQSKTNTIHLKNEELEASGKQNSQRIQELEAVWKLQDAALKEKIELLQEELNDVRNEKEKLESKHKAVKQAYQEERLMKEELQIHLQASKEDCKRLQEVNLELRSRQISKKGEDESYMHNLKVQLKAEVDRCKEKIAELIKEGENQHKSLGEKDKQISTLKNTVLEAQQEKAKNTTTIETLQQKNAKLTEEKSEVQQKLNDSQKEVASLKEKLEKAKIEIQSQRELKVILEGRLKESHQLGQQLLVKKENLENSLANIMNYSTMSQEEQRTKITQLQESLNNQLKKSGKLFNELTEKSGALELNAFLIKQLQDRLAEQEASNAELKKDIEDRRNNINKLNLKIEELNRKLMGTHKEKDDFSQEKKAVQEQLDHKKAKILELQAQAKALAAKLQSLTHQLQDTRKRQQELKDQKSNLQASVCQLRESLSQAKKEVQRSNARESESKNKLNLVQQQLKEKEEFYQNNKSKNWDQSQREANTLREKVRQLENKIEHLQAEREEQRETHKSEIEYVSHSYQQLQELLQEKEEIIERQENELHESQSRIISLTGELRSCLQAWQKEKSASLPSRRQASKIQEDLSKFQTYATELDKKTKELITAANYKIKDQLMAKTAQSLVELLEMLHRPKSRALSRASDSQKDQIVKQYDRMRDKVEEILKNQKITISKE